MAMFKISAMVYMFNAIIQQQTLVCVLPTPNTANHSIFEDSHGQNWNTPMMSENLTRSDHSKWKKMGEQWMTNMLVCQAGSSQIWEANRTRMDQAWVIRTSAFPLPPLISSAREQAMLRAVRMAFLMATYKSCQELVKYQKHLEIQVSSLKRMKRRR
jgi:hypothetical protein